MPAIITHRLFAEYSSEIISANFIESEEEQLTFFLANQGPDPFFFHIIDTPQRVIASRHMASRMHATHITATFEELFRSIGRLPSKDRGIARAFALGLLAHYTLDRTVHPFVYAQQYALTDIDQELKASSNEVHALIEGDIDSWFLWHLKRQTVREYHPANALQHTDRICRVIGTLMAHIGYAVYGISIQASEYHRAVNEMEIIYRAISPAESRHSRMLSAIECMVRPHSLLGALAHRVQHSDGCAAANLEHLPWVDPFTGTTHTDDFLDRFEAALKLWPVFANAFVEGTIAGHINHINYSGQMLSPREDRPLTDDIILSQNALQYSLKSPEPTHHDDALHS